MKYTALALALLLASGGAYAQDSSLNSNTSASANTNTAAQSTNAGVQATVNQISSGTVEYGGHFSETVKSQVPVSVVGYGSFSQNSCMTSTGVGATTRIFSFVYNGPTADINCQHVVQGDAFGRATQLAKQVGVNDMARASLSMVFYAYCTSSEDYKKACIQMKLVTATGTSHKEGKVEVADVIPALVLPEGAEGMIQRQQVAAAPIPSRPAGWTNAGLLAQQQSQQIPIPAGMPSFEVQQDAFTGQAGQQAVMRATKTN